MQWVLIEQPDRERVRELSEALGVSRVIASILISRGITTAEEAEGFFNPSWEDLHDPFLMKDMDKAVERIIQGLNRKERFLIYGDYDVDGITAVSLLTLFLNRMGADVSFYIPDRLKEGYGLSSLGIGKAADLGANILITVDCGITGEEEVALAKEQGIDVIISDHHEPGRSLPDAVAIIDPKQLECPYPFKELAGVGVAYKLVEAISKRLKLPDTFWKEYIDLVALGSAADIVPLVQENRVLVKKGLEKINRLDRIGIFALVESSGLLGKKIGTGQVVFILAPRINAVGRLGNAERAVSLLITNSQEKARDIASILESENRSRKTIDEETFQEACRLIDEVSDLDVDRALVLAQEGWHPGVIGIVASRIAETVCRPTIMIAIEEGVGKGSARSIANFDIYTALKKCDSYLLGFGGHRYAAGLTIHSDQINAFREAFKKVASETIQAEDLIKRIKVDAELSLQDINDSLITYLNLFSPFGPQNMRPVFCSQGLQVVGTPRIVGKNHLKFKVRQGEGVFDAIGFDLGNLSYRLTPGESNLDMVYVIEENYWNGQSKMQLRVKDLR